MSPRSMASSLRAIPQLLSPSSISSDAEPPAAIPFDGPPPLGSTTSGGSSSINGREDSSSSIVRETVAGFRGGKQWNIMEDTPGGHAPEKLVIVRGVEVFDEEDDESLRHSLERSRLHADDEEDDDILDDRGYIVEDSRNDVDFEEDDAEDDDDEDDEGDASVARTFRTKSLPSDPGARAGSEAAPRLSKSRFDPSYTNNDMWTTDDDASLQKAYRRYGNSSDLSLLSMSDPRDASRTNRSGLSSSYGGISSTTDEISEHDEIDDDHHTGQSRATSANPSSVDRTKTPTEKRSGGRRHLADSGDLDSFPELSPNMASDLAEDDEIDEEEDEMLARHPASVPEDGPLGSKKKSSSTSTRRKTKSSTVGKPSNSSRRSNSGSSNRRTTGGGYKKKSDALDRSAARFSGRDSSRRSDIVPSTPVREISSYVRSPLSSSLTSTPNSFSNSRSWVSSIRQQASQQQAQGTSSNANNITRDSPRRRKNKPLHMYMESHRPQDLADDEHTLGASTITTNFSVTQRTYGDNTVSTRSLFRSEPMPVSEPLQIPRRRADSDHTDEDKANDVGVAASTGSSQPKTPAAVTAFDILDSVTKDPSRDSFDPNVPMLSKLSMPNSLLRRPSGDNDELLLGLGADDISEDSSGASSLGRRAAAEKPQSKKFLQLDPNSLGLTVNNGRDEGVVGGEPTAAVDQLVESSDDAGMPELTDWKDSSGPVSPGDGSSKRRFKLKLFKRGKSWKGAVALADEEDDG
jgi:hypothetical protein